MCMQKSSITHLLLHWYTNLSITPRIWNSLISLDGCSMKKYVFTKRKEKHFTKKLSFASFILRFVKNIFIYHSALFYRYQNRFRPTYKIAFKTVTELEWRCCPGYQGPDCKDLKPPPDRQTVQGIQPYLPLNPGHTTRHTQSKKTFLFLQFETSFMPNIYVLPDCPVPLNH